MKRAAVSPVPEAWGKNDFGQLGTGDEDGEIWISESPHSGKLCFRKTERCHRVAPMTGSELASTCKNPRPCAVSGTQSFPMRHTFRK